VSAAVSAERRFTGQRRCPICGGADGDPRGQGKRCGGFLSSDGRYAHCSREGLSGGLPVQGSSSTYAHRLYGSCQCGVDHGAASTRPEVETHYDYRDEQGTLLYQVVRKPGKRFLQRVPDGSGGWVWKLNGSRRVLYRLPELLAADPRAVVYIVEGEKDVDTLRALGHVATCNPQGAGKWGAVSTLARDILNDRDVVVIADRDEPGRKHAADVAASVRDIARSARVVECTRGKDVSDHLSADGTMAELEEMRPETCADTSAELPLISKPVATKSKGHTHDGTDLRNAERMIERHGRDLRFVGGWGKWMAWDGRTWLVDDTGAVMRAATDTARSMVFTSREALGPLRRALDEAMSDADPVRQAERTKAARAPLAAAEAEFKWGIKSQNASKLAAMVEVARSFASVAVSHDALDADPWLLNVQNGTIDLRTGGLREHRRGDLLTKSVPVPFDPNAKAPTWDAFLARSMGGSGELVSYVQRLVGYALTGDVSEHVVCFMFGPGANGKSTALGALHAMLGAYASPAPRGLLFRSRGERHPTELASLHGRRFVTCSEIEEGQAFDEALVKDLTGGDPIECRRMREDFWSFLPTHKLFLAGNHKPIVRGDDEGIWRRIRLVPWTVTIPEAERDTSLPEKLRAELPGILAWAVRGCLAWQRGGLAEPESVKRATGRYREENNVIGDFFRRTVVFERDATVARRELREAHESFCQENGSEPFTARRFAGRLRERGVTDTTVFRDGKVLDGWRGVRLATDAERAHAPETRTDGT
jgi:putative DNA primase/helicase